MTNGSRVDRGRRGEGPSPRRDRRARRAQAGRGRRGGGMTVGQLGDRYLEYKRSEGKRSIDADEMNLERLVGAWGGGFGADTPVRCADIGRQIADYTRDRAGQRTPPWPARGGAGHAQPRARDPTPHAPPGPGGVGRLRRQAAADSPGPRARGPATLPLRRGGAAAPARRLGRDSKSPSLHAVVTIALQTRACVGARSWV